MAQALAAAELAKETVVAVVLVEVEVEVEVVEVEVVQALVLVPAAVVEAVVEMVRVRPSRRR